MKSSTCSPPNQFQNHSPDCEQSHFYLKHKIHTLMGINAMLTLSKKFASFHFSTPLTNVCKYLMNLCISISETFGPCTNVTWHAITCTCIRT